MLILATAATALIQGGIAISQARKRNQEAQAYGRKMSAAERDFESKAAINPYRNVKDLSSTITNPYANLQVATQAAEMAATETDISLANTLDVLRQTGAGAGSITALAREAARGKQSISASIEQQEAANARLRAQGEAQRQARVMAEQQRLQQAEASGLQYQSQMLGQLASARMDRYAKLQDLALDQKVAYQNQALSSLGTVAGLGFSTLAGYSIAPTDQDIQIALGANITQ